MENTPETMAELQAKLESLKAEQAAAISKARAKRDKAKVAYEKAQAEYLETCDKLGVPRKGRPVGWKKPVAAVKAEEGNGGNEK